MALVQFVCIRTLLLPCCLLIGSGAASWRTLCKRWENTLKRNAMHTFSRSKNMLSRYLASLIWRWLTLSWSYMYNVGIFSEYKVQFHRHRKQSGSLEAMLQHCTFRLQNKVKGIYSSLVLRLSQYLASYPGHVDHMAWVWGYWDHKFVEPRAKAIQLTKILTMAV